MDMEMESRVLLPLQLLGLARIFAAFYKITGILAPWLVFAHVAGQGYLFLWEIRFRVSRGFDRRRSGWL